MFIISKLGAYTRQQFGMVHNWAAIIGTVVPMALRRRYWPRTVRQVLAHQILSSGVESARFVAVVAVLVGMVVVVQATYWVRAAGQAQLLGTLLVTVVARELAPLLAGFVVIVKSGSVMTTELGLMKISGELRVLEAQGVEPFTYLVIPRVVGAVVATLCLTLIFNVLAFGSGYVFGMMLGITGGNALMFTDDVMRAVTPRDGINIFAKCVLPAMVTSVACCTDGLGVDSSVTEVPLATQRSMTRSVAALFVVCAVVSFLTYLT